MEGGRKENPVCISLYLYENPGCISLYRCIYMRNLEVFHCLHVHLRFDLGNPWSWEFKMVTMFFFVAAVMFQWQLSVCYNCGLLRV